MTIDGETYEAFNEGKFPNGTTWMVRWHTHVEGESPDNDFKETLITIPSDDPETAIRAAIERGSWA